MTRLPVEFNPTPPERRDHPVRDALGLLVAVAVLFAGAWFALELLL